MKEEQTRKKTEKANKKAKKVDHTAGLKRKVESADEDEQHQDGKKKKKNKKDKLKEHGKGESAHVSGNGNETNVNIPDEKRPEEVKTTLNLNNVSDPKDGQHDGNLSNKEVLVEKKNKKKKAKESEGVATANDIATTVENKDLSTQRKQGRKRLKTCHLKRDPFRMGWLWRNYLWVNQMAKELLVERRSVLNTLAS